MPFCNLFMEPIYGTTIVLGSA